MGEALADLSQRSDNGTHSQSRCNVLVSPNAQRWNHPQAHALRVCGLLKSLRVPLDARAGVARWSLEAGRVSVLKQGSKGKQVIRRWVKVEAHLALDGHGWVRGVVVPDCFKCDGTTTYYCADALSDETCIVSANLHKAKAHVRRKIAESFLEGK